MYGGGSALDGALETLRGKSAKKRKIQFHTVDKKRETQGCHVLFFSGADGPAFNSVGPSFLGKSILTISDTPGFAEDGGIIGLYRSEDKVRFAINLDVAKKSGLRISSQLLKLGKIVSTEGR